MVNYIIYGLLLFHFSLSNLPVCQVNSPYVRLVWIIWQDLPSLWQSLSPPAKLLFTLWDAPHAHVSGRACLLWFPLKQTLEGVVCVCLCGSDEVLLFVPPMAVTWCHSLLRLMCPVKGERHGLELSHFSVSFLSKLCIIVKWMLLLSERRGSLFSSVSFPSK